ncbi:ribosome recycling factor [Candidatus Fermentibacteria bacterium]|nr:MAG: ribosome recycling factor [Candidatus Fermentibacteria bacterium]
MYEMILLDLEERAEKTLKNTSKEMSVVRTGKASPALLDNIRVEVWGDTLPLRQVAGISAPEPRLLVIQPWDASTAPDIAKAIESSELGLRANVDGPIIRIPVPKLSEERRRDLIKHVKKLAEDGKTAIRNIRRDANDSLKKACRSGDITEDEEKKALTSVQEAVDKAVKEIDRILQVKEEEILEV